MQRNHILIPSCTCIFIYNSSKCIGYFLYSYWTLIIPSLFLFLNIGNILKKPVFKLVITFCIWFCVLNMITLWAESQISCQVLCNIGYPSETHLELKSRMISFVHNIRFRCPIVLKICTEHGSIIAVRYAKFRNDLIIDKYVRDKRDFMKFGLKMRFGRIYYIGPFKSEGVE